MSETIRPKSVPESVQAPQFPTSPLEDGRGRLLNPFQTEAILEGVNLAIRTYLPPRHFGKIIKK